MMSKPKLFMLDGLFTGYLSAAVRPTRRPKQIRGLRRRRRHTINYLIERSHAVDAALRGLDERYHAILMAPFTMGPASALQPVRHAWNPFTTTDDLNALPSGIFDITTSKGE